MKLSQYDDDAEDDNFIAAAPLGPILLFDSSKSSEGSRCIFLRNHNKLPKNKANDNVEDEAR